MGQSNDRFTLKGGPERTDSSEHSSVEPTLPSSLGQRGTSVALRSLILAAAVATFALVTLGGVVRATDSGLGCPDWPLCQGRLIPPAEYHAILEYSHRMVASLVGGLVVLAAGVAWWRSRQRRWVLIPLTLAVPLVGLAAWLGRSTVLSELDAATRTAHLATAQVIFALLLTALVWSWQTPGGSGSDVSGEARTAGERSLRPWVVAAALATLFVLLSGSYVVGRGAGAVCPGWPFCDGGLLPDHTLRWLHMTHRVLAGGVGIFTAWVAVLAWRRRGESALFGLVGLAVLGLLVSQILAGAANPWSGFTPAAQAIHLSLATALWGGLVVLAAVCWRPEAVALSGTSPSTQRTVLDYVSLMKPRIVVMLLVTALGGMFLAAKGPPPLSMALLVMLGGTLGSGGAQAINHYWDRDIDRLMRRTRHRPVADYRITPRKALVFGVVLNVAAFVVLTGWVNLLSALLTLSATLFYVFVYTGWLKRSTPQNIVIGGAAGAVPPLVGWAAVTGGLELPALYLFAIVFFWTPPHFWALALLLKRDYAQAKVPMLPVVMGEASTARSIMLHTIVLVALTVLFFTIETVGILYLSGAVVLGVPFLFMAWRLLRSRGIQGARPLYLYSLLYLAGIFALVIVDSSINL